MNYLMGGKKMEWLNKPELYENMGDCDFYLCNNKVYPCPIEGFCPIDICGIDYNVCAYRIGELSEQ